MKYILILGNITFHHFEADELALFQTDKEQKALVHELDCILLFDDKEKAYQAGDDAESYIIFPDFKGELIFETTDGRNRAIKDIASLIPIETITEYSQELATALGLDDEGEELGEMDFEYNGQKYPAKEVLIDGEVELISVTSLSKAIMGENDLPKGEAEEYIDNQIFYYVEDAEFNLPNDELTALIEESI